ANFSVGISEHRIRTVFYVVPKPLRSEFRNQFFALKSFQRKVERRFGNLVEIVDVNVLMVIDLPKNIGSVARFLVLVQIHVTEIVKTFARLRNNKKTEQQYRDRNNCGPDEIRAQKPCK